MEWASPLDETKAKASDLLQAVGRAGDRLVALNSRPSGESHGDEFWLDWPVRNLAQNGIDTTILNPGWETLQLSSVVAKAMSRLQPNLARGVIHGDIHGRNILLLDRLPAFIDFRWSGAGHPLVDLVRLDAAVRTIAMRMILPKQSMFQAFEALYVNGQAAEQVLADHSALAASPLTALAVHVAERTRLAALRVAQTHSLGPPEFLAMTTVVSAHVLSVRNPGSGVERLLLAVLAPHL
jgi:Ser/Thr protein kinase RdoA (MazF antagonist)